MISVGMGIDERVYVPDFKSSFGQSLGDDLLFAFKSAIHQNLLLACEYEGYRGPGIEYSSTIVS